MLHINIIMARSVKPSIYARPSILSELSACLDYSDRLIFEHTCVAASKLTSASAVVDTQGRSRARYEEYIMLLARRNESMQCIKINRRIAQCIFDGALSGGHVNLCEFALPRIDFKSAIERAMDSYNAAIIRFAIRQMRANGAELTQYVPKIIQCAVHADDVELLDKFWDPRQSAECGVEDLFGLAIRTKSWNMGLAICRKMLSMHPSAQLYSFCTQVARHLTYVAHAKDFALYGTFCEQIHNIARNRSCVAQKSTRVYIYDIMLKTTMKEGTLDLCRIIYGLMTQIRANVDDCLSFDTDLRPLFIPAALCSGRMNMLRLACEWMGVPLTDAQLSRIEPVRVAARGCSIGIIIASADCDAEIRRLFLDILAQAPLMHSISDYACILRHADSDDIFCTILSDIGDVPQHLIGRLDAALDSAIEQAYARGCAQLLDKLGGIHVDFRALLETALSRSPSPAMVAICEMIHERGLMFGIAFDYGRLCEAHKHPDKRAMILQWARAAHQ